MTCSNMAAVHSGERCSFRRTIKTLLHVLLAFGRRSVTVLLPVGSAQPAGGIVFWGRGAGVRLLMAPSA